MAACSFNASERQSFVGGAQRTSHKPMTFFQQFREKVSFGFERREA